MGGAIAAMRPRLDPTCLGPPARPLLRHRRASRDPNQIEELGDEARLADAGLAPQHEELLARPSATVFGERAQDLKLMPRGPREEHVTRSCAEGACWSTVRFRNTGSPADVRDFTFLLAHDSR